MKVPCISQSQIKPVEIMNWNLPAPVLFDERSNKVPRLQNSSNSTKTTFAAKNTLCSLAQSKNASQIPYLVLSLVANVQNFFFNYCKWLHNYMAIKTYIVVVTEDCLILGVANVLSNSFLFASQPITRHSDQVETIPHSSNLSKPNVGVQSIDKATTWKSHGYPNDRTTWVGIDRIS